MANLERSGSDLAEADLMAHLNRASLAKTNQHIPCEGSAIFNIRCKKRGAVLEEIITGFTKSASKDNDG
jgi:hypothetical protein